MINRLGVFGGTFDPPHLAHLILAAEAKEQLRLERILWVLTPDPPHKQSRNITPLVYRLRMLQAALQDNPAFELSRIDIDRDPPLYALDTIRIVGRQNPEAELVYLFGGDSLRDLLTWHRPTDFIASCHGLGVMRRPGARNDIKKLESQLPGIIGKLQWINAPLLQVSGSDIRHRAAHGQSFRYFLLPDVYEIIQEQNLYRD